MTKKQTFPGAGLTGVACLLLSALTQAEEPVSTLDEVTIRGNSDTPSTPYKPTRRAVSWGDSSGVQSPGIDADLTSTDTSESVYETGGLYDQPEWVKRRRFPTTRVYIQRDPWEIAIEQWWRGRHDGGDWKHRMQEELEIGLPGRNQLDLYEDWEIEHGDAYHLDFAAELRHALAEWGDIPLNPTLYFEYKWTDPTRGGDVVEPKLLLGDEICERWNYGLNLIYERELGGSSTEEWQVAQGIATDLSDCMSLGLEAKYTHETVAGGRSNPEHKFQIGPSMQFRPSDHTHLDLVALIGANDDAPDLETYLVFGIDFGGSAGSSVHAPVSGRR